MQKNPRSISICVLVKKKKNQYVSVWFIIHASCINREIQKCKDDIDRLMKN